MSVFDEQDEESASRRAAMESAIARKLRALTLALRAYDPDQPRVPAGQPDGGRWTSVWGGAGGAARDAGRRVANVIWVCVVGSASRTTIDGVKTFRVEYVCPDGNTVTITGFGHNFRGLFGIVGCEARRAAICWRLE